MVFRVIIVVDNDTGQRNVTYTRDFLAPVEDFLPMGKWANTEIYDESVEVYASPIIELMLDTELRGVDNVFDLTPAQEVTISEDQMERATMAIDEILRNS